MRPITFTIATPLVKHVEPEPNSGCWLWIGAWAAGGYGYVRRGGRTIKAARFIYETLVGEIPEGLQLDHLCRVRSCVNPAHLEPVVQAENIRRAMRARSLCRHGHPLDGVVCRSDGRRERICLTCRDRRNAARRGAA